MCFYVFMKNNATHLHQRVCRVQLVPGHGQQLDVLSRWVTSRQGRAIIHIDGKPAAVLVTYHEYNALEKLRTTAMKTELLHQLHSQKERRRTP